MAKRAQYGLALLVAVALPIRGAAGVPQGPPDPELLGCTRVDPNGRIIGMQTASCSGALRNLVCTLVDGGVDTVDLGQFAGESFTYDAECQIDVGRSQVYHYKTSQVVYKEGVNGYGGTRDTFIRPDDPDSVMPALFAMEVVARTGATPWIRGLVRFTEQQVLPTNAQIIGAELTMVCQEAVPAGGVPGHLLGGGMNVRLYGLLKEFHEDEATWNHYISGLTWEVPGAEGDTDRFTAPDDTRFILTKCDGVGTDPSSPTGGDVVPTPYTWNVLGSYLAQKGQGKEEYGWVFFTLDGDEDAVRFFTHEMSQVYGPKLVVKYLQ